MTLKYVSKNSLAKKRDQITHVYGNDKVIILTVLITAGYLLSKLPNLWYGTPSRTLFERQYDYLLNNILRGHEPYICSIAAVVIHWFTYWSTGAFFTILDMTKKPEFLYRYKIQDEKYKPATFNEVKRLALRCILNQIFVSIPFAICMYYPMKWRGCSFSVTDLPDITTVLFHLYINMIFYEIGFYYIHRFTHIPIVYKHIHKIHHEWTSPVALTSFYFHPIDLLISVYVPLMMGVLASGCHANVFLIWIHIGISSGLMEHTGYKFPLYPSPELHTLHHQTFNNYFGTSEIFDLIHGTVL